MNIVDDQEHPPASPAAHLCADFSAPTAGHRSGPPRGLPAGGCLPEHDHGPSHVALFPTTVGSGCTTTAPTTTCAPEPRPASASAIVGIPNPGPDHAELVVVAATPEFA